MSDRIKIFSRILIFACIMAIRAPQKIGDGDPSLGRPRVSPFPRKSYFIDTTIFCIWNRLKIFYGDPIFHGNLPNFHSINHVWVENLLKMVLEWSDLFLASILDHRFPRWNESENRKCFRLTGFSSYKPFLTWKIDLKCFQNDPTYF